MIEYVEAGLLLGVLGMQVFNRFGPAKEPPPETLPASVGSMAALQEAVERNTAVAERMSGQIQELSRQNENLFHALR